jgi:hypothetical protein
VLDEVDESKNLSRADKSLSVHAEEDSVVEEVLDEIEEEVMSEVEEEQEVDDDAQQSALTDTRRYEDDEFDSLSRSRVVLSPQSRRISPPPSISPEPVIASPQNRKESPMDRSQVSPTSPTANEKMRGELVSSWKEVLKEPLDAELRVIEEEGDLADDSFTSLDVPTISAVVVSDIGFGNRIASFVSVVLIQKLARGFLGRRRAALRRAERADIRRRITDETVAGNLDVALDAALLTQQDVLGDSFARF